MGYYILAYNKDTGEIAEWERVFTSPSKAIAFGKKAMTSGRELDSWEGSTAKIEVYDEPPLSSTSRFGAKLVAEETFVVK